jgi:hypothetical protein
MFALSWARTPSSANGLLEARADSLCDAHRLGGIRVHHDNAELVAADAGHNVTGRE